MTRVNTEQINPWFAKAGAACSIVPIARFVSPNIFALKGGGYGCLFSLTGIDEEGVTDLELDSRMRSIEGALRGLPEGSCLYQYTRIMSGFDLPRQAKYANPITEVFASDRLDFLNKTAAFRRIDLHWCLTLEPSKAKAFERKPQENVIDTSRMLADLGKTATILQSHLGTSLGLRLLDKADTFQFFSYLFNLEEWAERDQLRSDTAVDRQIVKSPVEWHSEYLQVGKRHVQMFSLKATPEASRPCLFSGLLTLDCDSVLCSTWRVKSTAAARNEIDAQEKFISFFKVGVLTRVMSGRDTASLETGAGAKAANINVDDLSEVIRALDKKAQGEFSLRLLLATRSQEQLRDVVPAVHRIFVDARAQVMEETLGNLSAFYAMFPGNHKFNVFPLWLAEDHHARLSSVFAPNVGHPHSEDLDAEYLNIFETRTRTPFFQDVYVDGVRVMLIIGPTGSGKSVHANTAVALEQKYGGFTYIFDIGASYESVVELYGGRVDRVGKDGPRVNPFALEPTESNINFLYSFVKLLLTNGGAELEPEDDDVIHRAVQGMTINAGVRVSLFGVFKEANHNAYNWEPGAFSQAVAESVYVEPGSGQLFNAATNTVVPIYLQNGQANPVVTNGIVRCGVNGVPGGCMNSHLWNPAPRVGFAWDPSGDGKTAVRGGYGIFFEHGTADEANTGSLEGSAPMVLSETQYNPPNAGCIGYVAPGCDGGNRFATGTPGAFPLNVTAIPTKAIWPYVQQWSFGVERELPRNLLTTLGYVGSKGTHLTLQREINQLIPTPAASNPYSLHEPMLTSDCVHSVTQNQAAYTLSTGSLIWPSNPAYTNLTVACYGAGYTTFGQGTTGATNPNSYRTYAPGMGNIYSLENTGNSAYNAFQFTLRRVVAPLTLGVAYTYSHSLDDSSDRSDANFVNSYDVRSNRASSNFDQRHLLHINYIYDLRLRQALQHILSNLNSDPDPDKGTPIPAPNSYLKARIFGALLDHWQLSGITLFETGTPFSVINEGSANGVGALDNAGVFNGVGAGSYPDLVGNPRKNIPYVAASSSGGGAVGPLLRNPGAFAAPRGLTFGDAGRNVLRNPRRTNFDMALAKHFTVMERAHFEFRAEAFNVFNHTQFRIYDPTLGNQANNTASCYAPTAATGYSAAGGGGTDCLSDSSFLHPVDAHRPRTIQFGLKLDF